VIKSFKLIYRYEATTRALLEDPTIDGIIVASVHAGYARPQEYAGAILKMIRRQRFHEEFKKPILGCWVGGREQMAIEAFANAMEIIPKTLSQNAGLDPIDIMLKIRSEHKKGNKYAGVNVLEKKVDDMLKNNVIEPIRLGLNEILVASEAATIILRIDDVIASKSGGGGGKMPQMPPRGGMSGMDDY